MEEFLKKDVEDLLGNSESQIFTSYFSNSRILKEAGVRIVSIARYAPRFMDKRDILAEKKELAPKANMLKMSDEEYKPLFKGILEKLDPELVIAELKALAKGGPIAMCCFEKPPQFCHRSMVADWLNKHGLDVKEFAHK